MSTPPNGMELDINRILRILPHRPPFLLLDKVTELIPRQSAKAVKGVTYNEPFFAGHFPGHPMMPGVLIVEALSQLSGILAYATEPFDTNAKLMYFLGIEACKFRQPVVPGDTLKLEVEFVKRSSNIWKTKGVAMVADKVCAEADLLLAITDHDDVPGRRSTV